MKHKAVPAGSVYDDVLRLVVQRTDGPPLERTPTSIAEALAEHWRFPRVRSALRDMAEWGLVDTGEAVQRGNKKYKPYRLNISREIGAQIVALNTQARELEARKKEILSRI